MSVLLSSKIISQTKFENITLRNGLPSNKVYSCLKDSRGFIWFATDNGICRYDGIEFQIFNAKSECGLTENIFYKVYEKTKDEILFISFEGFLYHFSYRTGMFTNVNKQIKSLNDKRFAYLHLDKENNYWLSTDEGLIKTDQQFNLVAEYTIKDKPKGPQTDNLVLVICEDKKGIFWLGMSGRAVMRFNPKTGMFSQNELLGTLPKYQQVRSIINDRNPDYVFIATGGEGLFRVNINNFSAQRWKFEKSKPINLPSDRIISLNMPSDSILWVGTLDGLAKINFHSKKVSTFLHDQDSPYSLVDHCVNDLYIDSQKQLWISTFGGISKLNTLPDRFTKVSQNLRLESTLASNRVYQCLTDKYGNLWIGSSKGFDIRAANNGRFYHYDLPKSFVYHKNEEVLKFFKDDENTWWIGTWGGGLSRVNITNGFKPGDKLEFINFFNDSRDAKSLSSNFIRSIAEDKQGNLWITTWNGGLNKIHVREKNKNKISFERVNESEKNIASNYIDGILADDENNLWLATSAGLQRVNLEKKEFEILRADPQNPKNPINTSIWINQDKQKNIWHNNFGGLIKITKEGNSKYSQQVIYNNSDRGIYSSVVSNDGIIWFSTLNSEIGTYNIENGKLKFYSMIEEVNSFDFYFGEPTIDKQGNIYFVGNSGYLFFNPANLPGNDLVPPVYITSIKIGNEDYKSSCDVSVVKEIELDYDQSYLTIGFAALNYIHSEKNQYKYLLVGFDKNWISLSNKNEITFTNLPAGKYNLKIIGSNNDEVWNNKGAELSIIIHPPFWQNNYYRVVFVMLVAIGIYMFFNSKIKRLRFEKQQQNQFSKLLIESQERERKRLSQELHDSLGQNLLVIKNQIDLYKSSDEKDETELNEISELVKESISEIKEISSNLHPHQLERLGLNKAIKAMINKIEVAALIEIESKLEDVSDLFSLDEQINIYRIVQESLNNIIKHADSKRATVEIKKMDGKIYLTVEDFGKGFDIGNADIQNKFTEGFGLKSIKERARLLNGDFQIYSTPNGGTRIFITIHK